jgi:hypothetical protein
MVDRHDQDGARLVLDAVDDAVVPTLSRVVLGEVETKFVADSPRVPGEASIDELDGCGRDLLWQAPKITLG